MSNLLEITFCFEPETLAGDDIASIFERTHFFEPSKVRTDTFCDLGCKFQPEHLRRLAKDPKLHVVKLETEAGMEGPFLYATQLRGMQCLYMQFSGEQVFPLILLSELACRKGFRAGYSHIGDDTLWQGETQIDAYVRLNRPHDRLPKIWHDDLNEWAIDISGNPARRQLTSKMWLQAAWRMWFGEEAQQLIPKELLLSFPDASQKSTLPCGTVFIELFDNPLAYDDPENRRRQQAFRNHAEIDAIIEKNNNDPNPDRHHEHQKGTFAFGGTHRFIRWMDDKGRTVLRSRSTCKEIKEYAGDGNLVKEWIEPEDHENDAVGESND
jgi:hypothetical protein